MLLTRNLHFSCSWWFYNSPEIRYGSAAVTTYVHVAIERATPSHVQFGFIGLEIYLKANTKKVIMQCAYSDCIALW